MPFAATWMGLEIIILSEVNQTEEKKHNITSLTCGILKSDTNELIYKQKQSHRHRKPIYGYQKGR